MIEKAKLFGDPTILEMIKPYEDAHKRIEEKYPEGEDGNYHLHVLEKM